jgi:hypothetical protein
MKTKFITLSALDKIPAHIAIPKFLFTIKANGKKLSCNAILVYALFLDRHALSFQNGWVNEKGEVYFVFKYRAISTIIGKSEKSVSRYIDELISANLIQKQVFNSIQPNRIFLTKIDDRGEVSRYTMADDIRTQGDYAMLPKAVADCKTLTGEEKLLYAVLYNRTRLSIKNKMANDKGEVYTRYSRKNLQETLNISSDRLRKYMTTLIDNKLLHEVRLNRSQCSYLYIKEVVEKKASINIAIDGYINDDCTGKNHNVERGQNRFSKGDKSGSRENRFCPHNKKKEKSIFRKTDIEKVCQSKTNNQIDSLENEVRDYPLLSETEKEVISSLLEVIKVAINTNSTLYISRQPVSRADYEAVLARLDLSTLIDVLAAYKAAAGAIRNQRAYVVSLVYQVIKEKPLKNIKASSKPQKSGCSNIGNFEQREYSDDFFADFYEPVGRVI